MYILNENSNDNHYLKYISWDKSNICKYDVNHIVWVNDICVL